MPNGHLSKRLKWKNTSECHLVHEDRGHAMYSGVRWTVQPGSEWFTEHRSYNTVSSRDCLREKHVPTPFFFSQQHVYLGCDT